MSSNIQIYKQTKQFWLSSQLIKWIQNLGPDQTRTKTNTERSVNPVFISCYSDVFWISKNWYSTEILTRFSSFFSSVLFFKIYKYTNLRNTIRINDSLQYSVEQIPWGSVFARQFNFCIVIWIYMHVHVIIILEIFVLLLWQRIQKPFKPFNLSNSTYSTFVGFILTFFRFRGWNGILEFESRRNKSSTYFSFRTGKYFASQEAPFLLSWIKTIHDQHSNALKFKSSIQPDHFNISLVLYFLA